MQRGGRWLSQGAESLARAFEHWQQSGRQPDGKTTAPHFDVIVVGSGYGGAVAAKRLSALIEGQSDEPMSVAVLERGLEYTPGSFPDRLADLVGHLRANGSGMMDVPVNPEGLMDWRLGGDVAALVANGLGGGSLINAGVCEPADAEVLARVEWPEPWRGAKDQWASLYGRARRNLGAQLWPASRVPKQAAMEELSRRLGSSCVPATLSIVPPTAQASIGTAEKPPHAPCIECGDCFTGCNVGAKRTLAHNYLADAWRQRAKLFTGATVHSVEALPGAQADGARWKVKWRLTDPGLLPNDRDFFELRARYVVLSAGTFGSTEILMRSRDAGLPVSGRLGSGFSANGDVLSAIYDLGQKVGGSPHEDTVPDKRQAGPTITQILRWQTRQNDGFRSKRVVGHAVQDLTIPGALGWVFSEILTTMMVPHRWTRLNLNCESSGDPDIYAVDVPAVGRSLLTVAYVDDGAQGRLEPTVGWSSAERDGELLVRWPHVGDQPAFRAMNQKLSSAATGGATFLHNPLWQFMPKENYLGLGQAKKRLLTVHPLGGCRMADNARDGVVDPFGAVFDTGLPASGAMEEQHRTQRAGQHDRLVHEGLYILDGAIVPTALGINPLLTITAIAEGAIDQWVADQGWRLVSELKLQDLPALKLPAVRTEPRVAHPTSVRFQERMQGKLPPHLGGDPTLDYRLSVRARFAEIEDLQSFLASPNKNVDLLARFDIETERSTRPASHPQPEPAVVTDVETQNWNCDIDECAPDDSVKIERLPGSTPLWLRGQVRWMAIEPSWVGTRIRRVACNFIRHRLAADSAEARHFGRSLFEGVGNKLIGATHFGAVRLLAYTFEPLDREWSLNSSPDGRVYKLPKGTVLFGAKRVGYLLPDSDDPESANPWRQISELKLQARLPSGLEVDVTTVEFDPMAALSRYELPIRVRKQEDGVAAMRDMSSLGLYFGRVMFGLHMFSFRRAEYPAEIRGPRRLERLPPTRYADEANARGFNHLKIEVHTVEVTPALPKQPLPQAASLTVTPLRLRLTRIRDPKNDNGGLPVLILHGFGSGGIQFTHPAITQPMAPWLATQGHDVWVAELRTSIGLESSRRQWTMDEVAREDIPALIRYISKTTGGGQVQVVAHCIGSAMFCMAALSGHLNSTVPGSSGPQSLVAGAALMQVGPEVELPRNSRARAYMAARLRQLMGMTEAHSVASQDITDAESMLDRIIGTFLYPKEQREHYRLTGDVQRNASRTNANRSAAIFGQLFEHENMTPELLAVMDDLLGSCNLTTYEQTAQYAFGHRLTNHAGEDVLVTTESLFENFSFPVFLLHGAKNKTFKPRTLKRNKKLLESVGVDVTARCVPRHGHLDCVVGRWAKEAVFKHVATHLNSVNARLKAGTLNKRKARIDNAGEIRLPRVGPWLGHVELTGDDMLELRVGIRVDDPGRDLQAVASVLAAEGEPLRMPQIDVLPRDRHENVVVTYLPEDVGATDEPVQLLVAAVHGQWPDSPQALASKVMDKRAALRRTSRRLGTPNEVSMGLRLDPSWLRRMREKGSTDLGLVLGACRQRPMLFDRDQADASMGNVARQLSEVPPKGHAPIDGLILAGDQVYVDMRVETGHAGGAKSRVLDTHHEAWSSPYQREVMRRRPTYMVLDDHEFRNDYNNLTAASRPHEFCIAKDVWQRYQLDAGPKRTAGDPAWRHFTLRGFAVFLCDTRSERRDANTVDRSGSFIMQAEQMSALQEWLVELHEDPKYGRRPKVIVTGSPIAPWFKEAHEMGQTSPANALRSDGWQRFPQSVADLLGFIAEKQIEDVLFLSGDYHRHVDVSMTIHGPAGKSVLARSIVTSGLYCPYPFVNANEEEWLLSAKGLSAGPYQWDYEVARSTGGSGYTRLSLFDNGHVQADFVAVSKAQKDASEQEALI